MQTILHKNDLSNGINFSSIVAADCEMMGLQPNRDPLCLIQLYDGKGDCHLVQFIDQNPIGRSSRSNPVTYLKVYDDIRNLYSKIP